MKYTGIKIEGAILSGEILDRLDSTSVKGQTPASFGIQGKVKDEIAQSWADSQALWKMYKRQMERERQDDKKGTTRTRNAWMVPFLELLGYQLELDRKRMIDEKSYTISHSVPTRADFPVHIIGSIEELDRKSEKNRAAMSPHSMVQEYLNLTEEHLYALVTNGLSLRLLRDSSRLIKLSYIEFDLEKIMEDELFADYAVLFRLIHISRMPADKENTADCYIENYHQDALEDGTRIRAGLSTAVEHSIKSLADGFLNHQDNDALRGMIERFEIDEEAYYHHVLMLVYRLLFLMVVEERHLIFPKSTDRRLSEIYYNFYSIGKLRRWSETTHIGDKGKNDLWLQLKQTFRLFQEGGEGEPLGIKPLGGDLFNQKTLGPLTNCNIDNVILSECIRSLNVFDNPDTHQLIRVNYGALNVEEFGSVYEGLLELDPSISDRNGKYTFDFVKGDERSSSGSHYTPEELTQPLIKHSLDYVIAEKLTEPDPAKGLLSIRVCDAACGSGHILLSAARRIALELARCRTGMDQPSPTDFRHAIRDVIRSCIYGVDKNKNAVELCKVALWLEAHNPGEPLNFLDHHIKCGDSIVGLALKDELENGIATEAFKKLEGDEGKICSLLSKRNKKEKQEGQDDQATLDFKQDIDDSLINIKARLQLLAEMPEDTPEEIEKKRDDYLKIINGEERKRVKALADMQTAQFFIPKTEENEDSFATEADFRQFMRGRVIKGSSAAIAASKVSRKKGFFHWFLEFPDVLAAGGFDCVLGNPPFLGGQRLTSSFGKDFLNYLKFEYAPARSIDLVGYFFRRIFNVLKQGRTQALISTNTIAQGGTREGSLDVMLKAGGTINFAIRSMPWPGQAAVSVSLVAVTKGAFRGNLSLDGRKVERITSYLDDSEDLGTPFTLFRNKDKSFQGSIVLGKGFILEPEEAEALNRKNPKNKDVIFPYLNGDDLNSRPDQSPARHVINFFDWDVEKAAEYEDCFQIIKDRVKPQRDSLQGGDATARDRARRWWQFARQTLRLYKTIEPLERVLVVVLHSESAAFSFMSGNSIYTHALGVIAADRDYIFAFLNSTYHYEWARKYSSTLGAALRYTPSSAFETFPFPASISFEKHQGDSLNAVETELEVIGEEYHEFRKQLLLKVQLGLTKTYNQFHNTSLCEINEDLTSKEIEKRYGKQTRELWNHLQKTDGVCGFNEAVQDIIKLRELHKKMDSTVLSAYGWDRPSDAGPAIELKHDFYEVDYLPENDRVRFTICPEARREILKRLLLLNHQYHEKEFKVGFVDEKGKPVKGKKNAKAREENKKQLSMF